MALHPTIASVGTSFPPYRYTQSEIAQALLADPSASGSGGWIAAARAVDAIGSNQALSARMQAALSQWLSVHQG